MNSKSIFHNHNIDFQLLNQSNNFEDACSPDDVQGFLSPNKATIPRVPTWHTLLSDRTRMQNVSADVTPNETPQGSPATNRKELDTKPTNLSEALTSKRWFNTHLFATFSQDNIAKPNGDQKSFIRKSNSCKNVSNFDINAVGPISF